MDYVGNNFCQSVKISMLARKMIVIEVDNKFIPQFKIEDNKKTHGDGLEHW